MPTGNLKSSNTFLRNEKAKYMCRAVHMSRAECVLRKHAGSSHFQLISRQAEVKSKAEI